jgi:hypothetical protein
MSSRMSQMAKQSAVANGRSPVHWDEAARMPWAT